jgi:hypothetical protein
MVLLTKSMPMVTLYVVSKVSYMKRVMMLVLPTASSPRKTSLYLLRGMTAVEEPEGVAAPDDAPVPVPFVAAPVAGVAAPDGPLDMLRGG